jgi:hypothetical protein
MQADLMILRWQPQNQTSVPKTKLKIYLCRSLKTEITKPNVLCPLQNVDGKSTNAQKMIQSYPAFSWKRSTKLSSGKSGINFMLMLLYFFHYYLKVFMGDPFWLSGETSRSFD